MARRRLEGLERVLGVNALFSTAYGNVGSSIYYALGLVAALALGLTPVVFVLTGALFYCTATTYAEATAMYPEAGGSSLFVRRAFNELWSFFTAWAQMLNYTITIAISAFFAAGYFGGVAGGWAEEPEARVLLGVGLIAVLALVNVRGVKDAVAVNVVLAVVDFLSQLGLVLLGVFLVFNVDVLSENLSLFGTAPTWQDFLIAIPIGTVAYTGIETISNMAGEARDEAKTIPAAIKRVMIAVFTIYFTLPWIALSALPVTEQADGTYQTLLGVASEDGGYEDNPMLGIVSAMDLGPLAAIAELYVGVLAVTILVAATNAGVLGVSRLVYSMGIHRQMPDGMRRLHPHFRTPYIGILVFSAIAALALLPGQADFLGAIYAFGAMLSFSMAHLAVLRLRVTQPDRTGPTAAPGGSGARPRPAAVRRARPRGHRVRRCSSSARSTSRSRPRAPRGCCSGSPPTSSTAAARASTWSRRTRSRSRARRRPRGRVRLRARPRRRRPLRRGAARHRDQARRPPPARDPRAGDDHGPERARDRRADGGGGGGRPSR